MPITKIISTSDGEAGSKPSISLVPDTPSKPEVSPRHHRLSKSLSKFKHWRGRSNSSLPMGPVEQESLQGLSLIHI